MIRQIHFVMILLLFGYPAVAEQNRFVFLTMLYNETDAIRIDEYKTCLHENKKHPLIIDIHVLYDTSKDDQKNELLNFLYEQNIRVSLINGRASYRDFFNLANKCYPDQAIILANADIYFNHTLYGLKNFDLTNMFLPITRWNMYADGTREVTKNYFTKKDDPGSHDTWIFKTPICIPGSECIKMGIMGCDGSIAYLADKAGYTLLNPCYSIETLHLHQSPVRHYWKEGQYKGSLLTVPCGYLPLLSS